MKAPVFPAMRRQRIHAGPEIERLIQLLARLPGLGPRSARRAALHLIARRQGLMEPLAAALEQVAGQVTPCPDCGNIDTLSPCSICRDMHRDPGLVCVVAEVGDLWAIERTAAFPGRYHVLGGLLSALAGVAPEDLSIAALAQRAASGSVSEIILALSATVEGQTTAHYVTDCIRSHVQDKVRITQLAQGVPVGGELDYLDEGTLVAALGARHGI